MNRILLVAAVSVAMGGCAAQGPKTAWAKANVTKQDYGTDVGMRTGYAAMASAGNGANTAGGINGQNGGAMGTSTQDQQRSGGASAGGPSTAPSGPQNNAGGSGAAFPTGSGAHRESMSDDYGDARSHAAAHPADGRQACPADGVAHSAAFATGVALLLGGRPTGWPCRDRRRR